MQRCSSIVLILAVLSSYPSGNCGRLFGDSWVQPELFGSTQLQHHPPQRDGTIKTSTLLDAVKPHPLCSGAHAIVQRNAAGVIEAQVGTYVGVSLRGLGDTPEQVALAVTGIRQNEPTSGLYQEDQCPDAQINGLNNLFVRLENSQMEHGRNSSLVHQGRMYYISFAAKLGQTACDGVVSICIPAIGADSCTAYHGDTLYDATICPILG